MGAKVGGEREAIEPGEIDIKLKSEGHVGWKLWVRQHPWTVAGLVLLALCCVLLAVLAPVCILYGCPPRETKPNGPYDAPYLGPPRNTLITRYNIPGIEAYQQLPSALQPYVDYVLLPSSGIQILTFQNEEIMKEAYTWLAGHQELQFLVQDFPMDFTPPGDLEARAKEAAELLKKFGDQQMLNQLQQLQDLFGQFSRRQLLQTAPNDPRYAEQTFHTTIGSLQAWTVTKGRPDIVVAVIDTGVDTQHPDLQGNFWVNPGEVAGDGIDNDGNGYVDDVNGYDFVGTCGGTRNSATNWCSQQCSGDNNPNPDTLSGDAWHGTHVAGLIAAVQNNWIGVSGVAPKVKIMVLKVTNCNDGAMETSAIMKAYDYAVRMGAHIVSCSFGNGFPLRYIPPLNGDQYQTAKSTMYTEAIRPLSDKGALVVAAAGNQITNLDLVSSLGFDVSPCGVKQPTVLCIHSTDPNDVPSDFSNFGPQTVHMSAPGRNIMSTQPYNSYGLSSGTSFSTPITSAAAALVLSILGPQSGTYFHGTTVKDILMGTGDFISGLPTNSSTRLNVAKAVTRAAQYDFGSITLNVVNQIGTDPRSNPVWRYGCNDIYYVQQSGLLWPENGLSVLDRSTRSSNGAFSNFKYGTGQTVSIQSAFYFDTVGLWTISLASGTRNLAQDAAHLLVGGRLLNTTRGYGTTYIQSTGWYLVDVQVPNPAGVYTLSIKAPDGTLVNLDGRLVIWGQSAYTVPADVPQMKLTTSWVVEWKRVPTNPVASPVSALNTFSYGVSTLAGQGWGQYYYAVIDDVNIPVNQFRNAISSGRDTFTTGIYGFISNRISPSTNTSVAFKLTCSGCALYLNDLPMLDIWENKAVGGATKVSSCINLGARTMYNITIKFHTMGFNGTAWQLTYTECEQNNWRSLTEIAYNNYWYDPTSAMPGVGWIPGIQCDIWRNVTIPASTVPPTWRVRMPRCPDAATQQTFQSSCQGYTPLKSSFLVNIQDLVPGILPRLSNEYFAVRCWTYMNHTATNAAIIAKGSASRLYWGGRLIANSYLGGDMQDTINGAFNAPLGGWPAGHYTLMVAEWHAVTAGSMLHLGLNTNTPLPIDTPGWFRLPIPVVSEADAATRGIGLVGGHFSRAYLPGPSDLNGNATTPGAVHWDMTQNTMVQTRNLTNQIGAWGRVTYATSLRNQHFYAMGSGYFYADSANPPTIPVSYTLAWTMGYRCAATMTMGDVTVLNAPTWNGTSQVDRTYQWQMMLPKGYVASKVVVKSARLDNQAEFGARMYWPKNVYLNPTYFKLPDDSILPP